MKQRQLGLAYHDYKESLQRFLQNDGEDPYGVWIDFREWYQSTGKGLFKTAFTEVSDRNIPNPKKICWLIEATVACNEADYQKKLTNENYYRGNAFWFLDELDRIVKVFPDGEIYKKLSVSYGELLNFIRCLISDSLALLTSCASLGSNSFESGLYKNQNTELNEFYQAARYIIYGSFITCHHSDVAISVIRQALELRIRRAFGIIAKIDNAETQFPVSLSEIIKAMEPYEKNIEMPIPLSMIKRVNGWANMYLHSGIKDYSWVAPRILEYISKFLLGGGCAPGFAATINSGFVTDKETFESIRTHLESNFGEGFRLLVVNQERCAVVIKTEPENVT